MTTDRFLTALAIIWAVVIFLCLFMAGIIHVEATPIWGEDDMTCGVWTFYADGVAKRAQALHGVPDCAVCTGLAVTVDRRLLGGQIEIRHGGEWIGPFLVVDVGTGRHRPYLVGEVDYPTAVAWRISRPWWTCYRRVL